MSEWRDWVESELDHIRAEHRWRAPRSFDALGPVGELDGRRVVSFASNDYLGLTHHPDVVAAAHEALDRWGAGSGSARLVVGSRPVHHELEDALAEWWGAERSVVFPTGFAANLSVLTTFGRPGAHIYSDALNHASIIDGCRLSRATPHVFPHGDLAALAELIDANPGPAIIVSDTVFSMDGDLANISGLFEVAQAHQAMLVFDEAHAVLGPDVSIAPGGRSEIVVIRVGTLSKTLGTIGGFVCADQPITDLLVNRARPYIFTTAPTPGDTAAALAAVRVCASSEGTALRQRLRFNMDLLRPGHPSPILPVIIGEESAAVAASSTLEDHGFLVPAIRPPTVGVGTSRLRIAVSAAHSPADCQALAGCLADLGVAEYLHPSDASTD